MQNSTLIVLSNARNMGLERGTYRYEVHFLSSPHVLTNSLDPVTQLIHTSIPILESIAHAFNLLHIQDLGLHPVNLRDLRNLINSTLQKTQGQSLHDQVLDLLGLDLRLGGDRRECEVAVVRGSTEDHFCEG